ncbi:hypothetical protein [Halobaculum magnesiiphilum]|uniref:Uncharacterized protein n=1 Tax=Halobaculum magnesiiphilum TaxID=1017351 RepID=A0A8T8WD92_9EURY|nr:hypothetical protein [Halobaculum magnesiiphilum]QZP37810.1 hypothetical protein K6T50_01110 [Halobaculum magnesiiphilum]
MDEALHRRLGAVERRQRIVITLLVIPYVLAALWFLFGTGAGGLVFTVVGTSFLLLIGTLYLGYRGRRPSRR